MKRLAILLLAGLALLACGSDDETVTVTEQAPEPAAQEPSPSKPPSTEKRSAEPETTSPPAGDETVAVPDVVGQDHQLAQDTLQAAGLYILDEEDCTGQNRALLWDRNWIVVEQEPSAGTKVSEDAEITLCSKKKGE